MPEPRSASLPALREATATNEGFKRLALLAGVVGILAWLTNAAARAGLFTIGLDDPVPLVIVSVPAFLVPFGFVHGVGWGVRGFQQAQ